MSGPPTIGNLVGRAEYDALAAEVASLKAEIRRLNMEMAAYRQGCTQADAKAMISVIDALEAEKSGRQKGAT